MSPDTRIAARLQDLETRLALLEGGRAATFRHSFSVYGGNGLSGISNTNAVVPFTGTNWNHSGVVTGFAGTSMRFTAPEKGYYQFHLQLAAAVNTNNTAMLMGSLGRFTAAGVNDRDFHGSRTQTSDAWTHAVHTNMSALILMEAGGYVVPRVHISNGTLQNLYPHDANSWAGYMVAPA